MIKIKELKSKFLQLKSTFNSKYLQAFYTILSSLMFGYFTASTVVLKLNNLTTDANQQFYADSVPFGWLIIITLIMSFLCYAFSTALKFSAQWLAVISAFSYVMLFEWRMISVSYNIVIISSFLLFGFIMNFCKDDLCQSIIPEKLKQSGKNLLAVAIISLAFAVAFYFFYYGTACRFRGYSSSDFDMGIFAQMYEYMAKTGVQYTTLERNTLLSHFAVHFSPIYYLLLPIYMLWRSPECLLFLQAAIILSGVIPVYKICRKYKFRNAETVFGCITYLFYPAFTSAGFYDFHENLFLPPFLLWVMYFLEKEKMAGTVIFTLLTLCVKEDAGLYIVFIGLYALFSMNKKRFGLTVLLMGIIGFALTGMFINHFGEGIKSDRFAIFITEQNSGLTGVVINVIKNPGYFLDTLLSSEKIMFIFMTCLPLMFICFKFTHWSDIFLIAPFVIVNLANEYVYQHDIDYQYIYGSCPLLFYLYIKNVSKCEKRYRLMAVSMLSSTMIWNYAVSGKYQLYTENYKNNIDAVNAANQCIETLDKSAVIYANTYICPSLYQFENVYLIDGYEPDSNDGKPQPEYLMLNTRDAECETLRQKYITYFPVTEEHGYILLMKKQ